MCIFVYISSTNIFAFAKILIILSKSYTRRDKNIYDNLKSNFIIEISK